MHPDIAARAKVAQVEEASRLLFSNSHKSSMPINNTKSSRSRLIAGENVNRDTNRDMMSRSRPPSGDRSRITARRLDAP